ncbi:MAG: hypothetical protein VST68_11380, partial [Nitrospirota bacterium]|nr:hypothetical protein [Nitrospirota bacterium]
MSPAQTQVRQDALFHGQGRSQSDVRSVLSVRERERREERQVCEPEGGKRARTPLAAPSTLLRTCFFQHSRYRPANNLSDSRIRSSSDK